MAATSARKISASTFATSLGERLRLYVEENFHNA